MSDKDMDWHKHVLDSFKESFHMAVQGCLQVMASAKAYRVAAPEREDCQAIKELEQIAQGCVGQLGRAELALLAREKELGEGGKERCDC